MKNVRKTIVTVAAMIVITLFVTESAAPDRPSSRFAPPFCTCSRTFSTTWYLRLEEAEPAAAVREVVHVVRQRLRRGRSPRRPASG